MKRYVDKQVDVIQDDGSHKCIIRGNDDQQWEQPRRDLQLYHFEA
jgi:hypothetical protein